MMVQAFWNQNFKNRIKNKNENNWVQLVLDSLINQKVAKHDMKAANAHAIALSLDTTGCSRRLAVYDDRRQQHLFSIPAATCIVFSLSNLRTLLQQCKRITLFLFYFFNKNLLRMYAECDMYGFFHGTSQNVLKLFFFSNLGFNL